MRTIPFDDGPRLIHDIEATFGIRSIWGTTVLNRKLQEVTLGQMVRITALGQVLKSKKGQKAYDWKVERAVS